MNKVVLQRNRKTMPIFPKIDKLITTLDVGVISDERKKILQPLVNYMQGKGNEYIRLNFICTHNSRRSHLSQIWAQIMAYYFGVRNIACYSGGTKATALFPVVAVTLQNAGLQIEKLSDNDNPIYSIKYADNALPIIGFSKRIDADFNPKTDFCAVMTCSQADKACPFVQGAEMRIPITYEDPKAFDNSPEQAQKYKERSLQIANEMKYVFSEIVIK